MEFSSFSSQTSKLLDALEKMGNSPGAELKSLGPTGVPQAELVKEFEMALEGLDLNGNSLQVDKSSSLSFGEKENSNAINNVNADGDLIQFEKVNQSDQASELNLNLNDKNINNNEDFLKVENNQKIENSAEQKNSSEMDSGEILDEIQHIMKNISSGNISAAELYRAQYLTAMFSYYVKSGNKVSTQAAQGIDQVLKQQ